MGVLEEPQGSGRGQDGVVNRQAILDTARTLGFLPITAAPEAVSEVDALYFLQPRRGKIVLRNKHRVGIKSQPSKP